MNLALVNLSYCHTGCTHDNPQLQAKVVALEQEVDVIFLQRQKEESRVRKIEARIAEIRKSVDQRIEMLAPEKLKAYVVLEREAREF